MAKTTKPIDLAAAELEVLERAQAGDVTVLPQLQQLLDSHPELWQRFGDVARHAEDALLAVTCGTSHLGKETIRRQLDALREELAGAEQPPPLERLLIERIALSWLQVHQADTEAARLWSASLGTPRRSPPP